MIQFCERISRWLLQRIEADVRGITISQDDFSNFGAYAPQGAVARLLDLTRHASNTWAGQKGASFLGSIAMKALAGRPLDVEALGARMRLYPDGNACEKRLLFTPQYFDIFERSLLQSRLPENPIFIDIGANIGAYSLFIAVCAGAGARILAIEPQPDIFERLVFNISQNSFASVKALGCAVTDCDGEITLFIDAGNKAKTSMRQVNSGTAELTLKVRAKALTTITGEENLDRIDAMNLDVEGAEDLILEPFLRQAPRSLWPRLLLIHCMPECWEVDLARVLIEKGYRQMLRTSHKAIYELS